MGIIALKDDDMTSELTERINANLRARAEENSAGGGKVHKVKKGEDPDLVEDSDYTRDLKKTGKFSWIWIVLVVLAVISLVVIALI